MQQVSFIAPGGPENLRIIDVERPTPKSDESLIEVKAAGINRPDLLQRAGLKKVPKGFNPVLGLEVSGILQSDNHPILNRGDEVVALTNGGGYGAFVCVPHGQILPAPTDLIAAAGICETWFTCWFNLIQKARLKKGEILLVHGAAGGIGSAAIQLGRIMGATIIATARSAQGLEHCKKLGADEAFVLEQNSFVDTLQKLTQGHGADVILDILGGPFTELNIKAAAPNGRLAQIAFLLGAKGVAHLPQMMEKGLTHFGSMLVPASSGTKARIANEVFEHVWPHFISGNITVPVDAIFDISDVAEAHAYMEKGGVRGKIILTLA